MRIILTILVCSSLLFSYQKGDMVSKEIKEKLNIKDDKIYVIDFFASWCASCKREMPQLSSVNDTIDKSKIELIGIDVDEDLKKGQTFQKERREAKELNFRVVDDPKGEVVKLFEPVGMPALYIVKEGKVVDFLFGARDDIDTLLLGVLKELE
ncbi:thiol:disulfide interchange protein (thioredoxin) [hydrothermal vent metagenome]|uniref:Thiol:disulfide interchange protein (Thioredoxin) n=1 Tax=hydrothermal vent metagenome TaxID=652676 RepID=A0A1W1C193_9ZZZZ